MREQVHPRHGVAFLYEQRLISGPAGARLARLAVAAAVALLVGLLLDVSRVGASVPVEEPAATHGAVFATWSDFYPVGWVNALPLSAGVVVRSPDGFVASSASYRTSINGGATWTDWSNAGLNPVVVDPITLQIAVNGIVLPDSSLQNRIQFQVTTGEGQIEQSAAYLIQVDTVAPAPPTAMTSTPSGWTNVNSFRESWTNPSDTSGIVGAYYRINEEPLFPTDGTFVATTNFIDGIQAPSEGSHAMLVWLVDGAGNVDHLNYRVHLNALRYDATPPIVGVASQGPLGQNNWYTGTVTLDFTPADATSGVLTWGWQLDGGAVSTAPSTQISADGLHSLRVTAADRAGNVMAPLVKSIQIDSEQPALGVAVTPPPAASGWYTAPLTVAFAITDHVSGPGAVTWRLDNSPPATGNLLLLAQDGVHAVTAYGQDMAGNRSAQLALNLLLDSHAPVTTLTSNPPAPQPSGFYTRPVSLSFLASDILPTTPPVAGSGVAGTRLRIDDGPWQMALPLTFTTSGIQRVSTYSFDVAGNREISHTHVISVDLEPPAAPVLPLIEPAGWSASNAFSLSWQNPPDTSGVVGAYVWIGRDNFDPDRAVFYPHTTRIDGLAAPGEGEWQVWMALLDGAGQRSAFSNVGALRYDATPPAVQIQSSGPQGNAGWFVGPAQVTLTLEDAGSGPELLRYRLDGAPWQQAASTATLTVTAPGRHVLDYYGQDRAGYLVGPALTLVRVDPDPPDAPIAAVVTPTRWSNVNQWTVSWRNPVDASGVAQAHLSWQPPNGPHDGQTLPAGAQNAALQAPAEGRYSLYLWLEDVAGNASLAQMATLADAVRYDATPPAITLQTNPAPNAAGWFRSAVAVTVQAADSLSGVESVTWQLDGQPSAADPAFTVSGDGVHSLVLRSVDRAGNVAEETHLLRIDTQAPEAWLYSLPTYHPSPQIPVEWGGVDVESSAEGVTPESSGLAGFDVEVRQGATGTWQRWVTGGSATSGVFEGQRSQRYSFRVRASDAAGNLSPWATAGERNSVLVDPVANGSFTTQNFSQWATTSDLGLSLIQEVDLIPGQTVPAARLGSPIWQACADPGNIPTLMCGDSRSSISQQITVPSLQDVPKPVLEVWYRVQSYDQITTTSPIWNVLCPVNPPPAVRWVDSFDVTVQPAGSSQIDYLLRDGNRQPQFPEPIEFRDLRWQRAELDLTAYAGQTIAVELASHNRLDSRFNTWTDVYGIRVRGDLNKVFLPLAPVNAPPPSVDPGVCWPRQGDDLPASEGLFSPLGQMPLEENPR